MTDARCCGRVAARPPGRSALLLPAGDHACMHASAARPQTSAGTQPPRAGSAGPTGAAAEVWSGDTRLLASRAAASTWIGAPSQPPSPRPSLPPTRWRIRRSHHGAGAQHAWSGLAAPALLRARCGTPQQTHARRRPARSACRWTDTACSRPSACAHASVVVPRALRCWPCATARAACSMLLHMVASLPPHQRSAARHAGWPIVCRLLPLERTCSRPASC